MPNEYLNKYKKVKIKCICPNCGKAHIQELHWRGGNVTPRIFCSNCKDVPRRNDEDEEYRIMTNNKHVEGI